MSQLVHSPLHFNIWAHKAGEEITRFKTSLNIILEQKKLFEIGVGQGDPYNLSKVFYCFQIALS